MDVSVAINSAVGKFPVITVILKDVEHHGELGKQKNLVTFWVQFAEELIEDAHFPRDFDEVLPKGWKAHILDFW